MKQLFTSVAALAVAGSMVSAEPAAASDRTTNTIIREGSRIIQNQQRSRDQRYRIDRQTEMQMYRTDAQTHRYDQRHVETMDRNANQRANQCERNQNAAAGMRYRYTQQASPYNQEACAPRVGPYGSVSVNERGYPVRSKPDYGTGAQYHQEQAPYRSNDAEYNQRAQFLAEQRGDTTSSAPQTSSSQACEVITVRGEGQKLMCEEPDGSVTLKPMAPTP